MNLQASIAPVQYIFTYPLLAGSSDTIQNPLLLSSQPLPGREWSLQNINWSFKLEFFAVSLTPPATVTIDQTIFKNNEPIWGETSVDDIIPGSVAGAAYEARAFNANLGGVDFRSGDNLSIQTTVYNETTGSYEAVYITYGLIPGSIGTVGILNYIIPRVRR